MALATLGVGYLTLMAGGLPWIALTLSVAALAVNPWGSQLLDKAGLAEIRQIALDRYYQ